MTTFTTQPGRDPKTDGLWDSLLGQRADLLLRLLVGGMLIPHGIGKFLNYAKEVEVFGQVFKLNPAEYWVVGIGLFQIAVGLMIVLNQWTRWMCVALAAFLVGTIVVANGGNGWFWHMKGIEYSVMRPCLP